MNDNYFALLRDLSQPIRAAALPHSLDHVRRLLDALGNPQDAFHSVVVTGSTGKGTACARIAQNLSITGMRTGLYTSPHLHSFRERFAVLEAESAWAQPAAPRHAQTPRRITQDEFVEIGRAVLDAEHALGHPYSTFESATALALLWFARQHIEIAALEIGIGGRYDTVNAVANVLAVFTPIEAEHVAMLGGSLESVAWHKAGIIQPNGRAVTLPQLPDVMAVLEREAGEKGAKLSVVEDLANDFPLGSAPPLRLPGRLERVTVGGRGVIIDGGHTPNAARHLRQFIGESGSIRLIVGMLRDKNVSEYLSLFDAPNVHFVYTHAPGDRALTPGELLERYAPAQASVTLTASLDVALSAVESAPESLIVVCGSLRMAAAAREAFGLLTPDELDEARRTHAIFEGEDYLGKLKNN